MKKTKRSVHQRIGFRETKVIANVSIDFICNASYISADTRKVDFILTQIARSMEFNRYIRKH